MNKELLGSIELNRIYQMDCLEGMALLPEKSIDMILCDLPYGTTQNKWDSIINLELLWEQYCRIIKDNGAIVLTAQTPFDKILGCSNLKMLKYEWIWEKTTATGHLNAKKMPMKAHENVLVFYKNLPTYNPQKTTGHTPVHSYTKHQEDGSNYGKTKIGISGGGSTERYPRSVQVFATDKQKEALHPTQKPVALFEYLIKTYSNEGEVVLDNCMGSGTTAVAALKNNRAFIGFETEEKYIEIANKRIESL
ncbi:site-specific DNA-methyltransferase (adenine-specific) [Paenibacillus barcinonensis]|uniref:Methyltransferase n=2 Tax=Paenibacillus barcinonensis TaxID=198119 RepID=A0A2V4VVZ3_PAEBA|nr:site-specific DNA-methyltransferase [Paenibacillus barcinonensis]PYE51476.1 site-specific DNA-methyltransferase (adenine-specific) [Paenibacillus barcinonensis]